MKLELVGPDRPGIIRLLSTNLAERGVKVEYLHSDVDTLRRVELLTELRAGIRRIVVRALFGHELGDLADEIGERLEPALRYVQRTPSTKPAEIIAWLKDDYDLGRGHAMALVHVIKNGAAISDKHVGTTGSHRDESDTLWLDGVASRPTA